MHIGCTWDYKVMQWAWMNMGRSYEEKILEVLTFPANIFGLWLIMVLRFYGGEG